MQLTHDTWGPSWIFGSRLDEIVWITNDVLAWCTGVHIVFLNINNKKLSFRWCWNQESGEGARCLSAHSRFSVFAFSEKVLQPRIFVLTYPSMSKVSECIGGCPSGYLATAFTAGDHMVSVGFYPHFPMIVWNWKTGDRVIVVDTYIRDEVGQLLRVTQLGPIVFAQMGKGGGRLFTWELDIVAHIAILKDHEVKLPTQERILWIDWSPTSSEPLLAISDINGHIYLSNHDGTTIERIVLSQRCGVCTEIEIPLINWYRDGIILRTTFCQIRFYTKNPRKGTWQRKWYVKSVTTPCLLVTRPTRSDQFFYHTLEGLLMQVHFLVDEETPTVVKFMAYGSLFKFADFVYPWCHHMAVTDDLKELYILECYNGMAVAKLDPEINGEISCQMSHPDYPLIVLGTTQGEVIFVSFIDPVEPKIVASLRLQRKPLDLMKLSYSGKFMVAAGRGSGDCYCIDLHRDKVYTVQTLVRVQCPIADLLVYEVHKKLKVLALIVGVSQRVLGQQLKVFEVSDDENLVTEAVCILDLPGVYRTISYVPGNPTMFLGSPYTTRQLRVQKVHEFKDVIMVDGIMTGHQVRLANLFVDRVWITTTAIDGLVFVRTKTIRHVHACVMAHHRADFGSMKAMVNRTGDLIVALGYNGSLVAIKSEKKKNEEMSDRASFLYKMDSNLYEKNRKKIASDYASLNATAHELLARPKIVYPEEEHGDKTWSEWRDEMQVLKEEAKCKAEKTKILQDFESLKRKVKRLLDKNEVSPDIEKLPVSMFDLDTTSRDQKLKAGRDECEDLRLKLEHDISEHRRVTEWIRQTFWDPQKVVGKSLLAIFGNKHVTNYPTVAQEPYAKERLVWAIFGREAMDMVIERETFRPWRVYTNEEIQVELYKRVKLKHEEEKRIDLMFEDEEEDEKIEVLELDNDVELEGTIAHRFIEVSPCYSQLETYGFEQILINNQFLLHDCEKLRAYFNKEFDQMYARKVRQMNMIHEKIERIRHIDSELKVMFKRKVSQVPTDPEWHWREKPEGIIKVLDHEVKAKPYVSPSMQEILDKQAAEAERIRLLLLADDFRERALMAMMDGVLEVRWEDIIKIDVPKPACMLQKKPDDYTADDIRLVKQYEKDVEFLQEERERYKRMLETEYTKVVGLLQEGIDKYNEEVDDLFKLKMDVESAMYQMKLRYVRGRIQVYQQEKGMRQEEKLKERIAERQQYEGSLRVDLQNIQNIHQQLVSKHELLSYKLKSASRRFRPEFAALSKLNQELLERQCKRRPRTNLKHLSFSEFLDLGNHVLRRSRPRHLPSECYDYLKALDYLDQRPPTLPPTIDTTYWDQLTRMRRQKIDSELKSRAREVQIMDANTVILDFQQRIERCRAEEDEITRSLAEVRRRREIVELDSEVQLVLKMGQVEIDTNGDVTDPEHAILVSRGEIEDVNKLIRAAGACKMKALSRLMNFQTGILMKEWEHECKRRRLEDLREDLRSVESVTVTKEIQTYLTRKARGMKDDKSQLYLQDHIESIKQRFQNILTEQKERLRSIEAEIERTRSKNQRLDQQIMEMNVARCEMEQRRDLIAEARQRQHTERKLNLIMKRAALVKKLQDNYAELLELQTEHELLRLKRYPTIGFKMVHHTMDDKEDPRSRVKFRPC